jgi:hypothetical protein
VRRLAFRMITAIQLTRLTMAFGAVSDVWFVILVTQARSEYTYIPVKHMLLPVALIAGATVAIGLFAFGASLNDILDVRHDSAFSPDRPIPAGRIRFGQAIIVTVGALIVAMLGGIMLSLGAPGASHPSIGAIAMTLLTATGILFYNAAGKYIPAIGLITVGFIHAVHMLIPNYQLQFTLPIWLVTTHAMVIAAMVHRLEDKRPRLRVRSFIVVIVCWAAFTIAILWAGKSEGEGIWPDDAPRWGAIWPVLAVMAFTIVARWKMIAVEPRIAAEKLKRYGAMWQALYGAAWLMALGFPVQAAWIGAFALAGFAAMTLIKEITGYSGRPVAYR